MDERKTPASAKKWLEALKKAERADKTWHDKCDSIDKLYSDLETLAGVRQDRQFQIFWANLEVLKPSIYSRPPTPVVTSRFRDRKQLPRRAADVLERALISDVEADDLHDTLTLARDDLATHARGVIWVRARDRDGIDVPSAEHIDRKDFRHGAARKWQEVPWAAKRAWMTKPEFEARFIERGGSKLDRIPEGIVFAERDLGADKDAGEKKAEVWEVWSKADKAVYFVSPGCDVMLDEQEPWHDLTGFYPCPRPAYGTLKRATLTPVPDFVYYKDQVEEINELTARMSALSEGVRLRGFYAAGTPELGAAVEAALASYDNRAILTPLASLAALGPNGSIRDAILWLPVDQIVAAIQSLAELRKLLIQDVYEITGLSDIMRGATDAKETATAQQLKSQYGSVRVRERQNEMVRLARDVMRLKAEIMAEEMAMPDLLAMAQVDDIPAEAAIAQQAAQLQAQAEKQIAALMQQPLQPGPDGQPADPRQQAAQIEGQAQQQIAQLQQQVTVEAIKRLYADQKLRPFALEVETDSTIYPDENAEKERRVEFMAAVGPAVQQAVGAMQQAPQLGSFVAEALRFVAGGFRAGRQMEDAIDQLAEQFANYQPPQPQGEDPGAAQAEAQARMAEAQAKTQEAAAKAQEAQGKVAVMQQELQIKGREAEIKGQETGAKIELLNAQVQKVMAEIGMARQQQAIDVARAADEDDRAERSFEREGAAADRQFAADRQQAAQQMKLAQQKARKP